MGYEIDFLSVGDSNGDAICIRYGTPGLGYNIHITDGGYADTGQRIIDHVNQYYGRGARIANVVLSHQDGDHIAGLIPVVRHFDVGAVWMNRPWLYAAEILHAFHSNYTIEGLRKAIRDAYPLLVELEEAALAKGIPVYESFAGSWIGSFLVLAPTRERYLTLIPEFDRTPSSYAKPLKGAIGKLFEAAKNLASFFETWTTEALQENPSPTSASNESCVIQLGVFDQKTVLLTADAGPAALSEAADVAQAFGLLLPPAFVQVPHHGSRRNVTPSVLNRWLGRPVQEGSANKGVAFCSVGVNKPEYPRKRVSNAFLRRGYPVYKTENAGEWIRHAHDMPNRDGMRPISSVAFTSSYEE
ncbi:competence protein ComEC [Rhizobium leguminosarum]|uniref:ComEC/Rec2 family competence protein n=1 Tax=Rhizobium leguminosarum TaxID=384 RepID=UPI0013F825EA|nr:competence protein ComEC [Rhizobium leguminosarum]NEJ82389.1 competence protein ComEC [Rhizobium leguminosarum]NKK77951.1 competence protein ComEC [Rhizobium leguminosarum bv. viciae]NKL45616.1 competence protein ComEC [Rhizobium leguminosarum bv. viciae]